MLSVKLGAKYSGDELQNMKLKSGSYFLIFLIILAVVFLGYSLSYPLLQDKVLGVLASSVMIGAGILQLSIEIKRAKKMSETEEQPERKGETASFLRRFGVLVLWTGGFAVASYLLGFLISVPLFLVSYLKWQRTSWWVTIIIAVVTTAAIYGFFEVLLVRPLWKGVLPIPWWLIPFL